MVDKTYRLLSPRFNFTDNLISTGVAYYYSTNENVKTYVIILDCGQFYVLYPVERTFQNISRDFQPLVALGMVEKVDIPCKYNYLICIMGQIITKLCFVILLYRERRRMDSLSSDENKGKVYNQMLVIDIA